MGLFSSFSFSSSKRRRHGHYGGAYYRPAGGLGGLAGLAGAAGLGGLAGALGGKAVAQNQGQQVPQQVYPQQPMGMPQQPATPQQPGVPQPVQPVANPYSAPAQSLDVVMPVPVAPQSVEGPACPECGAATPAGSKFCLQCGKKLETQLSPFCPNCGGQLPEGAKFCPNCGTPRA